MFIKLLLATLLFFYPIFGMELPLCPLEKEIFLRAIKHVAGEHGLSEILKELDNAQQNKESVTIILKFHRTKIDEDELTKQVYDIINFKDQAFGYIPHTIKKQGKTLPLHQRPTNYLGNYTRYWHKEDVQGPYIKCKSLFTSIELLCDALKELEEK